MTKPLSDLAHFQLKAAERRRLLELGQIRVETAPDTRALTRQIQAAASSASPVEGSSLRAGGDTGGSRSPDDNNKGQPKHEK